MHLTKQQNIHISFPAGFAHQYNLNCATLREIPFPSRVNRAHRILITII